MTIHRANAFIFLVLLISACDDSSSVMMCEGPAVTATNGQCSAQYHKIYDREFASLTTQAIVTCRIAGTEVGGNIVAFSNGPGTGIGLRWISNEELEVALDPRVKIPGNTPVDIETEAQYFGKRLRYVYRDLQPTDPAWHGCTPE